MSTASNLRLSISPVASPLQKRSALELQNLLILLVKAIMKKPYDAGILLVAITRFQDFAVGIKSITVRHRLLQANFIETQLRERVLATVLST